MNATPLPSPLSVDDWFRDAINRPENINPCVRLYGLGPENVRCKDCRLLFYHTTAKKFFKCELRRYSHGPATDHRANWPACARFVQNTFPLSPESGAVLCVKPSLAKVGKKSPGAITRRAT